MPQVARYGQESIASLGSEYVGPRESRRAAGPGPVHFGAPGCFIRPGSIVSKG
ncbi:hypothetical protein SNOG_07605 [Parastagonospora nodorum SN15]|uniref:Uncharacterized protein n=1 Tax=Phaeosphaeria nodorum (strain SN15 / ATCC MYA-4574 / FGSC 10173) TaxID=321614 RepID=Q0UKV9_PHANO|nr:hypothetical protein SNOG_07605 [Parastagonospora nodorum SN15]EAT85071.1 hypothetical protein SNOG_07605 [Parastagonospora nodorum SN15]